MDIRSFLKQHGFRIHDHHETGFHLFVRYYEHLAIAVFFNHLSGEFYMVRFESVDELAAYRNRNIKMSIKSPNDSWCISSDVIHREPFNLLPMVNLSTIIKLSEFKRAFLAMERMIETEIVDVDLGGIRYGQRVIVRTIGHDDRVGIMVAANAKEFTVVLQYGGERPFPRNEVFGV